MYRRNINNEDITTKRCLIMSDLDGTLLNSKGELSQKTIKIVQELSAKGHIFCIATGRPYRASINFYKQLKLKTVMVNYNGSLFSNPSNKKFDELNLAFSRELVVEFFKREEILKHVENALIEGHDGAFFWKKPSNPEQTKAFLEHFHLDPGGENNLFLKDFSNIKSDVNSILLQINDELSIDDLIYKIKSLTTTLIARSWSIPYAGTIIEINSIFSNKGMALKYLSSYYGIPLDSCLAFGDGDNDNEMLRTAYFGFAMKNGTTPAKLSARFLTEKTNNDNGVGVEIKRFFELKSEIEEKINNK